MKETKLSDNPHEMGTPIEFYAEDLGGQVLGAAARTDPQYAGFLAYERSANHNINVVRNKTDACSGEVQAAIESAVHWRNARRLYEQRILHLPLDYPEEQ